MSALHPISREILASWQVRKSRAQKEVFRAFVTEELAKAGYQAKTEEARMVVKTRNLVIGAPDTARVIFTAHYDTCAVLPVPNFITPLCLPVYLLYQLFLTALILGLAALVAWVPMLLGAPPVAYALTLLVCCYALLGLILAGPACRHTANDNTSGVIAVLETALALPEELRASTAFVLFDLEEAGLFGSAAFARAHPGVKKNTLVVNLDCVSDGSELLLVLPKGLPAEAEEAIRASYVDQKDKTFLFVPGKKALYPSDQANFRRGVACAAMRKTKRGLLYVSRLHTVRDVIFEQENIFAYARGNAALAGRMAGQPASPRATECAG